MKPNCDKRVKASGAHKRLKAALAKEYACYVLITCQESTDNGEMEVEMTYEGDPSLATYLLEGAQSVIDEQQCEEELENEPNIRVIK